MRRHWWQLTWLVTRRELRQRGTSKTFAVTTVILVLGIAAAVVIPAIVARAHHPSRVGIVGGAVPALTRTVREAGRVAGVTVTVVRLPDVAAARARLRSGELAAVLVGDSEVLVKQAPVAGASSASGSLPTALAEIGGLSRLFAQLPSGTGGQGLAGGLSLPVRGLVPPAANLTSRITGLVTVILIYALIGAYGAQVAIGVGEEKSSRVVEVLLATVRPVQLLVGKVLGIGLLVLAQTVLMVATYLALGFALGSGLVHGASAGVVAVGAVWFVLGYAFYCVAFAAAGSMVSRQSEVGAISVPLQIPLIVAYVLSFTVLYSNGANVFYQVLAYLPPTAPVAMTVLFATGVAAAWQVALSAVLCLAATVGTAWLGGMIYQRSILRTGARVRLRQVLRRESVGA